MVTFTNRQALWVFFHKKQSGEFGSMDSFTIYKLEGVKWTQLTRDLYIYVAECLNSDIPAWKLGWNEN